MNMKLEGREDDKAKRRAELELKLEQNKSKQTLTERLKMKQCPPELLE